MALLSIMQRGGNPNVHKICSKGFPKTKPSIMPVPAIIPCHVIIEKFQEITHGQILMCQVSVAVVLIIAFKSSGQTGEYLVF